MQILLARFTRPAARASATATTPADKKLSPHQHFTQVGENLPREYQNAKKKHTHTRVLDYRIKATLLVGGKDGGSRGEGSPGFRGRVLSLSLHSCVSFAHYIPSTRSSTHTCYGVVSATMIIEQKPLCNSKHTLARLSPRPFSQRHNSSPRLLVTPAAGSSQTPAPPRLRTPAGGRLAARSPSQGAQVSMSR